MLMDMATSKDSVAGRKWKQAGKSKIRALDKALKGTQ